MSDIEKQPPLKGLKVVELARVLAGPWIGQTLADLGADVIKVESPSGDETRHWGPPFVQIDEDRSGAYFHSCNRGKRSVIADFSTDEGRETVRRLAADADVLIENFKVGGLVKFGLDYDSLSKVNQRLVYCSVTGFGQTGPYAPRAGYDFIIQAMSGFMELTGEPEGEPQKGGVAVSDLFTGLYGVIAVQSALLQRERTGRGQHVDLALFDCMTAVLSNPAASYFTTGRMPKRYGNAHAIIVPYQTFEAQDGLMVLAVGNNGQFARACKVLGTEEWVSDPRFATNEARVENREILVSTLEPVIARWKRAELLGALETAGVPAGPVNTIAEAFADPQFIARGMRVDLDGIGGIRTPIVFSQGQLALDRRPPRLGEHTQAVLGELSSKSGRQWISVQQD
ncbi:MAG: CoA transferase [Salaquimonas sp.]|nr:CoA transferase [Salaquimonas sp.]